MAHSEFKWWQSGVIYQIYPRSFMDSNSDGIGDLPGITAKLDYLHWLGVDAIWISPFYPSPMKDFGYDVSNYIDVHPMFGTMADFEALLAKAHGLGLRVIVDYVPNHTSDEHPWFIESRSSRENPKRDWYVWRNGKPDGSPPNNWLSYFGGSAWEWDEKTKQFYLHSFLKEQPDLNWRNPLVRHAMLEVLRFWLDLGVDGFRVDVIYCLIEDEQLRDELPNPNYVEGKTPPKDSLMRHYCENQPEIHDVIREFRRLLDLYGDRVCIGENAQSHTPEILAAYYGSNDGVHLPYNFKLIVLPWEPKAIRDYVNIYHQTISPFGWPNYVLGNHDQPRLATRIGKEEARVAAMLLLTLHGTPTIYYGEEIGMENVDIAPEEEQDPYGRRVPGFGRDAERTPMQWNDKSFAGFSSAAPWLPVSPHYTKVNVEALRHDPTSMLHLYRRLLAYRKVTPALQFGDYLALDKCPEDCLVYLRTFETQRCLVALNFSGKELDLDFANVGKGRVAISTYLDDDEYEFTTTLKLRPHEGCVLEIES